MNHMEHNEWLDSLTGGATTRAVGKAVGVSHTTIARQLSRGALDAEIVMAACRAYDRLPAQGLIETGYLKPWEVEGAGIDHALDQATNAQLLDAIMRRSDPDANYLFGIGDDVINPDGNVVELHSNAGADDVGDDGILEMPEGAVADSGGYDEREEDEFD